MRQPSSVEKRCIADSSRYMEALQWTRKDWEIVKNMQDMEEKFFYFEHAKTSYTLSATTTCTTSPYWQDLVQCESSNDTDNATCGSGTSHMTIIQDEQLHHALLDTMRQKQTEYHEVIAAYWDFVPRQVARCMADSREFMKVLRLSAKHWTALHDLLPDPFLHVDVGGRWCALFTKSTCCPSLSSSSSSSSSGLSSSSPVSCSYNWQDLVQCETTETDMVRFGRGTGQMCVLRNRELHAGLIQALPGCIFIFETPNIEQQDCGASATHVRNSAQAFYVMSLATSEP